MTFEEMQGIEEWAFSEMRKLRETKGREYAHDADTLADFKEVAAEAGITPLQCWLVYERKHSRAIGAFTREGAAKSESIESRIVDVITYHLLLLGLIRDEEAALRPAEVVTEAVPQGRCDRCFRLTYEATDIGTRDAMELDREGRLCGGIFRSLVWETQ